MVSSVLTFEGGKSSSNSSSVDNKYLLKSTSTSSVAHLTTSTSSVYNNNNNDSTTGTTPSTILNDHISLLFPKCRPRNDVILNSNSSNHNTKNLRSNSEITSSVITETTQSSVYSSIVQNNHNNNNNSNQQSPPTSSLSSSETSSSTKSPNIGTNPFISNLSTGQHYDSGTHSTIIGKQMGDIKRIMNNDNDNSANHILTGLQQTNLSIKNMSNQIDGMSKYSHKRMGIQNKQNYHQQQQPAQQQQQQPQQQQQQQQQQTHNYYQYNQNPFIKDSERCVWELRNRNTPLNNSSSASGGIGISSVSGGGGGGGGGTPSSTNSTTPSSTVLNSPDLIEMETKLNFTKQNHSTIKVGRSPVNNHHYTILDHHSNNLEPQQQQPIINLPSSQLSSSHHAVNGNNSNNILNNNNNNNNNNNSVPNSNNSGANSSSSVIVGGMGGKSLNVISDGEVVVFDDIGDSYNNTNNSANNGSGSKLIRSETIINSDYNSLDKKLSATSPTTIVAPPGINTLYSSSSAVKLVSHHQPPDLYNCSMDTTNPNKKMEYGDMRNSSGIMEYDGSPRKFGQTQQIDISMYTTNIRNPQQSSSTLFPPRPGFPQRILNNASPVTQSPHQNYQQQQPQQAQQHQMHHSPHQIQAPIQPISSDVHNMPQNNSYHNQCNTDDTSNDVSEICNSSEFTLSETNKKSTFDYLYEFSETRKVLEEFFKCPSQDDDKTLEKFSDFNGSDVDSLDIHYEFRDQHHLQLDKMGGDSGESYIGSRLAKSPEVNNYQDSLHSPKRNGYLSGSHMNNNLNNNNNGNNLPTDCRDLTDFDLFLDSASRSSGEIGDNDDILKNNGSRRHSKCFRYSPETTDYDSNCGDLDSEVSLRLIGSEFGLSGEFNNASTYSTVCTKLYTSMPVLEDGLSSGHASDTENNNNNQSVSIMLENNSDVDIMERPDSSINKEIDSFYKLESPLKRTPIITPVDDRPKEMNDNILQNNNSSCKNIFKNTDPDLESLYSIRKIDMVQLTPPPPAPAPHRKTPIGIETSTPDIQAALQDIRSTLQRTKTLPTAPQTTSSNEKLILPDSVKSPMSSSPIWVPRLRENSDSLESIDQNPLKNLSGDEDEADTDLETDRLLGHQRLDDMGFYDEKTSWCERKPRSLLSSSISKLSPKIPMATNNLCKNGVNGGSSNTTNLNNGSNNNGGSTLRPGLNTLLPTTPEISISSLNSTGNNVKNSNTLIDLRNSTTVSTPEHHGGGVGGGISSIGGGVGDTTPNKIHSPTSNLDDSPHGSTSSHNGGGSGGEIKKKTKSKEVLIEGVLFRARYLGSTQLVCEGQPTKSTRMIQAEEAVSRIKSPDGETQPSTEVDLFISTEKIMVLNTDLKEIMMDHALRTISYIADIGDLVVLMARRRFVPSEMDDTGAKPNRTPKMICHVFESEEAQFIAQSIGQAFQVAYMEFLKANGIEDHSFVKEMDYQEVLNSQEIFGDELEIFAKKELQKEVVVPKAKGEILGVVIVESGWGSMLPTVVIANLLSSGAAARCGQLNIGDQIIAINGLSLVGLPLSTCQTYIKNTKNQTVVKFTVVPCAPVVEVKIKRPNTKYQLGFSVQNGVICSLLRGGIAERGGVRVGHRIIEINNQSVVAVPHEKIVNLLATSVGEILMKTMPTSMFRLLTGQENPIYI